MTYKQSPPADLAGPVDPAGRTDLALADLEAFWEQSLELLCVLDSSEHFLAVNPAFAEILGWSGDDLLGRPFADGIHPDDREGVLCALAKLRLDANRSYFSARIRQASGSYVRFLWRGVGTDRRYRLVGRRAVGQPGEQPARGVRQSATVGDAAGRAKTEFLASMNHELRTPLNAILGYTELLSGDDTLKQRQRDALHAIKRSSQHLLLLINDVLDFARLDANRLTLSPQEFLLSGFLDNFTELFGARARERGISFVIQTATPLPVAVCADETRLRQVLLNLLSNAVKFTDRGGVVLRAGYSAGVLRFEVEDTGIGIPAESLEAVFQPFEQIPDRQRLVEGTGLGLSLCRHLVDLMGGVLSVESEMGRGSTFWFEIEPARVSRWPEKQVAHTVITGHDGPERCILVADDQPQARIFLCRLLHAVGMRVVEAENGRQAVDMAVAARPDLIFMDLVMPELDGFEASRRIRSLGPVGAVPIIATSVASPLVEIGVEIAQIGNRPVYDGFLNKPIDVDQLYDLVAEHLQLEWQFGSAHSGEWSIPDIRLPDQSPGQSPDQFVESPQAAADRKFGGAATGSGRADAGPGALVTLDTEQLQAIFDAATIGDIREILSILERAGYQPDNGGEASLADKIYQFARAFRSRDIKELVQPYLL